jgi:N-methylhydantoinase B/oxoprolinase/acetone carboxylase alpha subunit
MNGGGEGKVGKHLLRKNDGTEISSNEFTVEKGDKLTIWTPSGGGYSVNS